MRKLGKFVFAALVGAMILACASCKTEDNSVSGATYKVTSVTGTVNGETITIDFDGETITFNSDGTTTMKSGDDTISGTWKQDGNTVTVTLEGESVPLIVSDDGSILTYAWSETEEGVTYSVTTTFTRQ